MKIPRDVAATELIKRLRIFGYISTRQAGSHIRLTTTINGEHHITIPNHNPIKTGTFSGILNDVATHHALTKEQVLEKLFS